MGGNYPISLASYNPNHWNLPRSTMLTSWSMSLGGNQTQTIFHSNPWTILAIATEPGLTLREQWTADSGGQTMKCRSVKPKPCEVRCRRRVLGPGQEKGSSSSPPGEGAVDVSLWSLPSFRLAWRERWREIRNLIIFHNNYYFKQGFFCKTFPKSGE